LDALITFQTSPIEAYNKFDALANEQLNQLRKQHAKLQEIVQDGEKKAIDKATEDFQSCLDRYIDKYGIKNQTYFIDFSQF
jgi:hypothetical protein